ncbi:hypothetical protein GJV85_13035 [Sulfurimonas aquatica]|uniref:Cytochrome c-552/4 domain-containing protein n=1 Tax=Sulfurimonas aquatica TaxID=2672570 RepID=A0A975B2L1_9BACT|nr:multiheme c-type cytochrome [Sulfurimonas aquatica]QSZ42988.1 hypothetical protein GJV85_13035 [Sulfurimonas aquatica]
MQKFIKVLTSLIALFGLTLSAENTSFTTAHFNGSGTCVQCHDGLSDSIGEDVSIVKEWSSSMMANATKDPLWKAKVRTEINRNPQLESIINDKCTKCHAPMANTEAHADGNTVKLFDDGFLNPNNQYHDAAMNGVSCTLCHQVSDNGKLGTLAGTSGKYEVNENRIIYGPYDNVNAGPMRNNVNYNIQFSSHIKDSKMCATCHNLKTPYVDENGNILSTTPESEFAEQMPYSEWEHSDYKDTKSCQDCHMQRTDGVKISTRPRNLPRRDGFARHVFIGANKTMLSILNDNKTALGVNSNNFEATLAKTETMLRGSASLEIVNESLANGELEVTYKVNSATGHKLPTSFPSRRVFLHTTVKDSQGNIVFESGKVNANGSIVGADSDIDNTTFEPHYDLITSEDQVQIYETIMADNLNNVTYTLLRALDYKKDNRLLPTGFDKTTAINDVKVAGGAYNDANFVGGSDTITYRVANLGDTAYSVETELLYQTVGFNFATDLFSDNSSEVAEFESMYNASNMKTSQIGAVSTTLTQNGGVTPPPPAPMACNDGLDNDGDGLVDLNDPGCTDINDNDEFNEIIPPTPTFECNDGIDNDGDGRIDMADSGCSSPEDNTEFRRGRR